MQPFGGMVGLEKTGLLAFVTPTSSAIAMKSKLVLICLCPVHPHVPSLDGDIQKLPKGRGVGLILMLLSKHTGSHSRSFSVRGGGRCVLLGLE